MKSWWFAWTGESHIWLVDPASDDEVARYRAGAASRCCWRGRRQRHERRPQYHHRRDPAEDGQRHQDEARAGEHFETVRRFKDASDLVGNVYQILCKGIPAPQINCEVAVPSNAWGGPFNPAGMAGQANPGVLHYPSSCAAPVPPWPGSVPPMTSRCAG